MTRLSLLRVFFAASDLVKLLKSNQDPNDAIQRLVKAVEGVCYSNEKEEPND